MTKQECLISIAIPVLNEAENIAPLMERLIVVAAEMPQYDFEFLFSDNDSSDSTWEKICEHAQSDSRVKGILFSKNVGFQNSILENFRNCKGNAIVQIDADLQDPPELIPKFLEEWQRGAEVVYGRRVIRKENLFISGVRRFGYRLIDLMSDSGITRDAGDFRLIDRKVADAVLRQNLVNPYLRGVISSLGFKQVGIDYSRSAREIGQSKFPLRRVFSLGFSAIINHSVFPLRLATYLGGFTLVVSILNGVYAFIAHFKNPDLPAGFTTTQLYLLASIGLNSLFLGIIGEYISRIYRILTNAERPIISKSINT